MFDITPRVDHQFQQFLPVLRTSVADFLLRLCPDIFFGIELRRVGRKPFPMQPPVAAAKRDDFSIPVDRAAIQQRNHRPAQVPQQLREVLHDFAGRDVPRINLKIPPRSLALGRHAQPSNDREARAPVTVPQHRRLTHRRPSTHPRWNEHKPAFIEEYQVRAQSPGFFLYAAPRAVSILGFSWGCVEGLAVRASDNSNPGPSEFSPHAPDDSRGPNGSGLARPPAGRSTCRSGNRRRALPPSIEGSTPASDGVSFPADGLAWAEALTPPCLCAGTTASSAPASLSRTEPCGPQLDTAGPALKAQPPGCAAPAMVRQNLRVSRAPR